MEPSLFIDWVTQYFPGITINVVDTLNDSTQTLTYLHRRFLRKEYSVTGDWKALSTLNTQMAADVVAMDSSLPLKKRGATSRANGTIPKMGMEMDLNETQLSELDIMVLQGMPDGDIAAKLFADVPVVIRGIYERNEAIFLEGLSTGICEVPDAENVGTSIRLNYGYFAENQFDSTKPWTDPTATPIADQAPMRAKLQLDGNRIALALTDGATMDAILATDEAKQIFAQNTGFFGAEVPTPSFAQYNAAIQARYGYQYEIVDRSVRYQKNGINTNVKPWKSGMVVFLGTLQLGSLIYTRLAEQNRPVPGVSYQTADDMILVSKFGTNRPSLKEFTTSQARCVPVIANVDQIYTIDSTVNQG